MRPVYAQSRAERAPPLEAALFFTESRSASNGMLQECGKRLIGYGRFPRRSVTAYKCPTGLHVSCAGFHRRYCPLAMTLGESQNRAGALYRKSTRPINQDALHWYLDHVHPHLLDRPDYQLTSPKHNRSWENRYGVGDLGPNRENERCTLFANVPSLSHLYSESSVLINPMQRVPGSS